MRSGCRLPTGYIAYYRQVHRSENFVLRDRGHDIIFASKAEAQEAAWSAFLEYLNNPITGLTDDTPSRFQKARKAAELIFLPQKPAAERAGE